MADVKKQPVQNNNNANNQGQFVFGKQNYILLIISLAIVFLGYVLMAGGGSADPNVFSEEIFSSTRITVAPILIIGGLALGVFAILKKPTA
jgi:isoprenylcysteine carboxyl methyltransferase (ICMT) family protein YpbQ